MRAETQTRTNMKKADLGRMNYKQLNTWLTLCMLAPFMVDKTTRFSCKTRYAATRLSGVGIKKALRCLVDFIYGLFASSISVHGHHNATPTKIWPGEETGIDSTTEPKLCQRTQLFGRVMLQVVGKDRILQASKITLFGAKRQCVLTRNTSFCQNIWPCAQLSHGQLQTKATQTFNVSFKF